MWRYPLVTQGLESLNIFYSKMRLMMSKSWRGRGYCEGEKEGKMSQYMLGKMTCHTNGH